MKRTGYAPVWELTPYDSMLCVETARYFDAVAEIFDDIYFRRNGFAMAPWSDVATQLGLFDSFARDCLRGRILDVGCGTGHWSTVAAPVASEISLCDISPRMLSIAVRSIQAANPDVPLKATLCDLRDINCLTHYMNEQADWGILGFVLSHYTDDEIRLMLHNLKAAVVGQIFFVDSIAGPVDTGRPPSDLCKRHFTKDGWVGIRKRYLSEEHWIGLFSDAGWGAERRLVTERFCGVEFIQNE